MHHERHEGRKGKIVTASGSSFVSFAASVVSTPWALIGLAIMIVSETATLARTEPFYSWNTPVCWTGFIIFADAVVYGARGNSWIRSAPREFVLLAVASIPLWVVFEWFNLRLQNWRYVGLPENFAQRMFGYAWSFATIWPAIFEGAELMAVWRARGSTRSVRPERVEGRADRPAIPVLHAMAIALVGALMLASPFLVSRDLARYMAAPVWLGFIFLLDPINARVGGESLLADWRAGRFDRLLNLALSGFLCGGLWEFWNYWSGAKWHYTVPIMENLKIFEMPLPGYFGFPPFALECFTMYVLLRRMFTTRGRPIAI